MQIACVETFQPYTRSSNCIELQILPVASTFHRYGVRFYQLLSGIAVVYLWVKSVYYSLVRIKPSGRRMGLASQEKANVIHSR